MDTDPELMNRIYSEKAERRRKLAALPFPEKIRMLVKLQQVTAGILRQRGIVARPWNIPEASAADHDKPVSVHHH